MYTKKLPSTLYIHQETDGLGNWFSGLGGPTVIDQLRKIVEGSNYGIFQQVEGEPYTYVPLNNMWSRVQDDQSNSSEDIGVPSKDPPNEGNSSDNKAN